jgi:hypothetical protein
MTNGGPQAQLVLHARARSTSFAAIQGGGNAVSSGVSNLAHTVAWGGISELRDPGGVLVDDFSAFSTSNGIDYRHAYVSAVPESGTAALRAAGLLVLWRKARTCAG